MHIDRGTKGSRAIGRSAYTTLNLHTIGGRCDVGHIDPEDSLRLRVVERYAIDGGIDASVVGATDAEIGVANAKTIVGGSHERGSHLQQEREIDACVGELEGIGFDFLLRECARIAYTSRCDGDFFEGGMLGFGGIVVIGSREQGARSRECEKHLNCEDCNCGEN